MAEEDRLGPEELRKAYPSNNLSAEGDDSSNESDLDIDIENDNFMRMSVSYTRNAHFHKLVCFGKGAFFDQTSAEKNFKIHPKIN